MLVVSNGTTYPSFRLHDFGCATWLTREKASTESLCGTFEWQPPENPKINSKAADIWALGALVHYLALGCAPIQRGGPARLATEARFINGKNVPIDISGYSSASRYYAAKCPRTVTPINLTVEEQEELMSSVDSYGYDSLNIRRNQGIYNQEYSDDLNRWMKRCLAFSPHRRATADELMKHMVPKAKEMLRKLSGRSGLVDLEVTFEEL